MQSLPEELVIIIFSYLSSSDLTSLTLTCKRFLRIIAQSFQILNLLTVNFTPQTLDSEWIGSRFYTNVTIIEDGYRKFMEIQSDLWKNVRKLKIISWNIKLENLEEVLRILPNLKELKFYGYFSANNSDLLSLNLEKLVVKGNLESLKILKCCKVKELHLILTNSLIVAQNELFEFLQNQKSLKSLKIENFSSINPLNQNLDFRLEKLSVKNCSENFFESSNFFINLHKNSLEFIELDKFGFQESKILTSFTYLKTIKIDLRNTSHESSMSKFDILSVLLSGINEFPEFFYSKTLPLPQVKYLIIIDSKENFKNFLDYFPNIESLVVMKSY